MTTSLGPDGAQCCSRGCASPRRMESANCFGLSCRVLSAKRDGLTRAVGGRPTDLVPSFLMSLMALLVFPTFPKQFAQPVGQWITLEGSPEGRLGGQRATLGPWAWPLLPLLVRSFALSFAFSWPI
ncbi:unnamed protein product [Rangifer tarandus platyrhynchus]|uniref:Uncharacterized protein n=2 Tax=Rangifer tarandus platyrhynchus TaxID=3082113 RepID=A0ABN8ZGU2_RANTA|nr:unnamed protein product [Rangifer tarandus platyrhynchus]